jgi:hypothetical protein
MRTYGTSDFRLSKWFMVDVDFAVRYLPHVEVGSISDASDVHAISICKVRGL